MIAVTVALFPLYLLVRHPYRRLPLHIDTGFYVSNYTVGTGRLSYARGWNARFAGGGKIVPELFYSLIYLRCGGERYGSCSRLWFSVFNYATAVAVGLLAWVLSGGGVAWYCAALVGYALLSSEPQYGGYHESGEQFEVLPQALAVLCLTVGLGGHSWWWCALAAFLWALETFAIKLTSAAGFVVLFGWACVANPWAVVPVAAGGLVAAGLYLLWLRAIGKDFRALFASMWGLQTAQAGRFDVGTWIHRLTEKIRRLGVTFAGQPVIPLLIVWGLIAGPLPQTVVWWYLAAAAAIYAGQGADIRYYTILLWPPLAVLAAGGVVGLLGSTPAGWIAPGVLGVAWLLHNSVRAWRADLESLNRWTWRGAMSPAECDRNLALLENGKALRGTVGGHSLLVYGPFNQAYILAGAGYDTPIITPAHWLDDMEPDWQQRLCQRLRADPPDFVLDSDRCFAAEAVRSVLGLDYELCRLWPGDFRLYELRAAGPGAGEVCHSYARQTRRQLAAEELRGALRTVARAGEAPPAVAVLARQESAGAVRRCAELAGVRLAVCSDDPQEVLAAASAVETVAVLETPSDAWLDRLREAAPGRLIHLDPGRDGAAPARNAAAAFTAVLADLQTRGCRRVGLYGAGRRTRELIDTIPSSPVEIVAVFDDDARRHGQGFAGLPIHPLSAAVQLDVDAVVICSQRFAAPMLRRCRTLQRQGVTVVSLLQTPGMPSVATSNAPEPLAANG